jgi:ADP-ribose pyrophosphatase YjhB (NUDIX family)
MRAIFPVGRIVLPMRKAVPGTGRDPGEPLHDSLRRECREAIGTEVEVIRLHRVADAFRERVGRNGEYRQQVEIVFVCRLPDGDRPMCGSKPDRRQEFVEWVGLRQLDQIDLRPRAYATLIRQAATGAGDGYAALFPPASGPGAKLQAAAYERDCQVAFLGQ